MTQLRSKLVQDLRVRGGITIPRQYLTGLDLFHGHIMMPQLLVYRRGFDIEHARRGLVEALKVNPMFSSRLQRDADGRVYVDGNDAGFVFRVHQCEGPMPYGPHRPLGKEARRFSKVPMPWQVIGKDLSMATVDAYKFDDGGIVLALAGLHSFLDGSTFWNFMHNWSKACTGKPLTTIGSFDRNILTEIGRQHSDPSAYGLMAQPSLGQQVGLMARLAWQAVTKLDSDIFRLPAARIEQWKQEGKLEMPDGKGISAGQLATAYILKAISPVMPHGHERSVGLVMDLRYMRALKLPSDYQGNALCWGTARYSEADVARSSVPSLADRCKPAAEQVSREALCKLLAVTESYRQKNRLWRLMFRPVADAADAGLIQNNMSRLPIYDMDLGNGTPDWYEGNPMTIRTVLLAATPEQDGGLDVHVTLHRAELAALRAQLKADGLR